MQQNDTLKYLENILGIDLMADLFDEMEGEPVTVTVFVSDLKRLAEGLEQRVLFE